MATPEPTSIPFVIASRAPRLGLEVGLGYLRFLTQRRRGARTFRRALLASGMPRAFAKKLTLTYEEAGSLRTILGRGFRMAP